MTAEADPMTEVWAKIESLHFYFILKKHTLLFGVYFLTDQQPAPFLSYFSAWLWGGPVNASQQHKQVSLLVQSREAAGLLLHQETRKTLTFKSSSQKS